LLGLAPVLLAAANLPSSNCDGEPVSDGIQTAVLIVVTSIASLSLCIAAGMRLAGLWRQGHRALSMSSLRALLVVALVVVALLGFEVVEHWVGIVLYLGFLGTGLCMLILLVAWIARRDADGVGLLVPLYLLGTAIFIYPGLALFALAINSGALC
jgi:hypothetical protein